MALSNGLKFSWVKPTFNIRQCAAEAFVKIAMILPNNLIRLVNPPS